MRAHTLRLLRRTAACPVVVAASSTTVHAPTPYHFTELRGPTRSEHAALRTAVGITDLGTPGRTASVALAINRRGHVADGQVHATGHDERSSSHPTASSSDQGFQP